MQYFLCALLTLEDQYKCCSVLWSLVHFLFWVLKPDLFLIEKNTILLAEEAYFQETSIQNYHYPDLNNLLFFQTLKLANKLKELLNGAPPILCNIDWRKTFCLKIVGLKLKPGDIFTDLKCISKFRSDLAEAAKSFFLHYFLTKTLVEVYLQQSWAWNEWSLTKREFRVWLHCASESRGKIHFEFKDSSTGNLLLKDYVFYWSNGAGKRTVNISNTTNFQCFLWWIDDAYRKYSSGLKQYFQNSMEMNITATCRCVNLHELAIKWTKK